VHENAWPDVTVVGQVFDTLRPVVARMPRVPGLLLSDKVVFIRWN
jgi:hypothetical protein